MPQGFSEVKNETRWKDVEIGDKFFPYLVRLRRVYRRKLIYCMVYGKPHLQIPQQDVTHLPSSLSSQIPQEGFHLGERNHFQIHMFGTGSTVQLHLY